MDRVRQDVVHALRSAARQLGATAAIVCVLALGVGLSTTIFALADPFTLRPLPYPAPESLVAIELRLDLSAEDPRIPSLAEWRDRTDLFADVAAYRHGELLRLRGPQRSSAVRVIEISGNLLPLVGVPIQGLEQRSGDAGAVLVLSAQAAGRIGDSGRGLVSLARQDGGSVAIAGTLPRHFLFPGPNARWDALTPVQVEALADVQIVAGSSFSARPFTVIARLQTGLTADAAQAALAASVARDDGFTVVVHPLTARMRSGLEALALGALGAGALILLICAANLGNLMLVRGLSRHRELATREALGASGRDLARLMTLEAGLLAACGVSAGLVLAHAVLTVTGRFIPSEYASLGMPELTIRGVLVASIAGLLLTTAGAFPAYAAWRATPRLTAMADARSLRRARLTMTVVQSAGAILLVSGAALLIRSYVTLVAQDTGFDVTSTIASVSYPAAHTGVPLQVDIEATLQELQRLPGVTAAGGALGGLVDDLRGMTIVQAGGRPAPVALTHVTPAFFEAVGLRLIQGRSLQMDDVAVVVVNEAFRRQHWPDVLDVVGRPLTLGPRPMHVVGLVADTQSSALDEPPAPAVYALLRNPFASLRVTYAVRMARGVTPPAHAVEQIVMRVNRDAIVTDIGPLRGRFNLSVRDRVFATLVVAIFATAGIGVCMAGIVGVVSFGVARRTREVAIRVCLGATPWAIRRLVLSEALTCAAAGAALGLTASFWSSRLLERFLFGVQPGDPATILSGAGVMLALVALAAAIPSQRAVRLPPSAALRVE